MSDTKAKIVEALDTLPEERQREVLHYVESLCSKEEGTRKKERDPQENPLLDLIGSVDEDLGSDRIDEQLYGEGSCVGDETSALRRHMGGDESSQSP